MQLSSVTKPRNSQRKIFLLTVWILVLSVHQCQARILVVMDKQVAERHDLRKGLTQFAEESVTEITAIALSTVSPAGAFDTICNNLACTKDGCTDAMIVIGNNSMTISAALISKQTNVPLLVYNTQAPAAIAKMYGEPIVQFYPDIEVLGRSIMYLVAKNHWFHLTVITDDNNFYDGFVDAIDKKLTELTAEMPLLKINKVMLTNDKLKYLETKLVELRATRSRIILVHCKPHWAVRFLHIASRLGFVSSGYAWLITYQSVAENGRLLKNFPNGMLTVELSHSHTDLWKVVYDMIQITHRTLEDRATQQRRTSLSTKNFCELKRNASVSRHFYEVMINTVHYGETGRITFNEEGFRNEANVSVLNFVNTGKHRVKWNTIGRIEAGENITYHANTIVWPGDSIIGPSAPNGTVWAVVTTIIEPFVFEMPRLTHSGQKSCLGYVQCLRIHSKDPTIIRKTLQAHREHNFAAIPKAARYGISCCKGYSMDVLAKLATDLNFRYQIYVVADNKSGAVSNGSWNGLVQDLLSGAADIAIAAFSITESRTNAIDFTYPYFFSGFSMMAAERDREVPLFAFLAPLDTEVWAFIFIVASITAAAMAILEWNSPFGLNPWGRRREVSYTLASAWNAVFAILFGHTVKTKTPKSWPCKLIQNTWGGVSIFIVASYTANLAAFIAGKKGAMTFSGIADPRLLMAKVGVKGSTAVENYVSKINNRLYSDVLSRYVFPDNKDGFDTLRHEQIDIYLGDTPVLQYAKSEHDPDCIFTLVGRSFGEDGYGIGLPKGSFLEKSFSQKIIEYRKNGFLEILRKNYFYIPRGCINKPSMSNDEIQMKWSNHRGLYMTLAFGLFICAFLLLPVEHIVYKWLVPYMRLQPSTSKWKNKHIMFISQRLYRIVTSQEMFSSGQAFREMIEIIRAKRFSRIFQKQNRQTMVARRRQRYDNNLTNIFSEAHEIDPSTQTGGGESSGARLSNGILPLGLFLNPGELLPWGQLGSLQDLQDALSGSMSHRSSIVSNGSHPTTVSPTIKPHYSGHNELQSDYHRKYRNSDGKISFRDDRSRSSLKMNKGNFEHRHRYSQSPLKGPRRFGNPYDLAAAKKQKNQLTASMCKHENDLRRPRLADRNRYGSSDDSTPQTRRLERQRLLDNGSDEGEHHTQNYWLSKTIETVDPPMYVSHIDLVRDAPETEEPVQLDEASNAIVLQSPCFHRKSLNNLSVSELRLLCQELDTKLVASVEENQRLKDQLARYRRRTDAKVTIEEVFL